MGRLRDLLIRRFWHLLGLAAVLPLVLVDPALIVLVYDAELLTLIGSAGALLVRADLRVLWLRVVDSAFVLDLRAGVAYTRERPRSLWTETA